MRLACDATALLGVLSMMVFVSPALGADEPEPLKKLHKRVYRNAQGDSIPYRLFIPAGYDPAKRYPVILFLHGMGERGADNELQLKNGEFLRLVRDDVGAKYPCFLVAPQCPLTERWADVSSDLKRPHKTPAQPTRALRLALEVLDALEKEFSIDPARRYVTGLSMGGFGTFEACLRRPGYFAAAVPICGGADDSRAKDLVGTSFWIFHGANDPIVPVGRSRSIYHLLKAAGARVKYTEYPGVGHNSWTKAYNEPDLPDWLFAQHR